MTDLRGVVLCADDYALNASVSAGILALARQGRLSATSVMTRSPRWGQDAAALRELRGQLDVGLHLDFTSDFACAQGDGASLPVMLARALGRSIDAVGLRAAIERQFDAFEAHWHAVPDHVDGHQHVHQVGMIRDVLQGVLMRRYGAFGESLSDVRRPWLRVARVAQTQFKARVIGLLGSSALEAWALAQGWPCRAPLLGVYGFDGGPELYAHRMQGWLAGAPARATLMCHPASSVDARDAIGTARVWEFEYFASTTFVEHLSQAKVRLARGGR